MPIANAGRNQDGYNTGVREGGLDNTLSRNAARRGGKKMSRSTKRGGRK